MPSLDSAYAQLDRCGEHLKELKGLHSDICKIQAQSTVVEMKLRGTIPAGQTLKAGEVRCPRPPVAIRLRIIAGETANCMRSALDYMVGQLVVLHHGSRVKRTQFPITFSPEKFEEFRSCYADLLSLSHIAAIEKLQPQKGCDWTALLSILTNFAKHDDLILLYHDVLITTHYYPVDPTNPDPFKHQMRVDFQNVVQIALNKGFPLIATLEMLKSQVTHTLDAFNPEFK